MAAAFTPYKFWNMFILVIVAMSLLAAALSIPSKKGLGFLVGKEVAKEVNPALAKSIEGVETIDKLTDPEGIVKQETGNYFYRLLEKDTGDFVFLALLITVGLFSSGIYLRDVRKFIRNIF